jgi:hypothetical protein
MYLVLFVLTQVMNKTEIQSLLIESNCCPGVFDPKYCCEIERNGIKYKSKQIIDFHKQQCCGVRECVLNLSNCDNNCSSYRSECVDTLPEKTFTISQGKVRPWIFQLSPNVRYTFDQTQLLVPINEKNSIKVSSKTIHVTHPVSELSCTVEILLTESSLETEVYIELSSTFAKFSAFEIEFDSILDDFTLDTRLQVLYIEMKNKKLVVILKPHTSAASGRVLYTKSTDFRVKSYNVVQSSFPFNYFIQVV